MKNERSTVIDSGKILLSQKLVLWSHGLDLWRQKANGNQEDLGCYARVTTKEKI